MAPDRHRKQRYRFHDLQDNNQQQTFVPFVHFLFPRPTLARPSPKRTRIDGGKTLPRAAE